MKKHKPNVFGCVSGGIAIVIGVLCYRRFCKENARRQIDYICAQVEQKLRSQD